MKYSLTLVIFFAHIVFAGEKLILQGRITDAVSNEPLAAANIRVLGTAAGTVANADGNYRLPLAGGTYTLVISSLGYAPDTLRLTLQRDAVRNVSLTPSDIVLPEVTVTSEDPAYEIIRRAIANKRKWRERLKNFEMDAFTRQVLKRDTAIASITESLTKGYWQQGDTLREIVKHKRQTENIQSGFNFASVGRIINFNDDEVRFAGFLFVGPTAVDAFDYYNYKLLRTRASAGREVYEIALIPRTRTVPLFSGTIAIAGESYALMGVDVVPNEAFTIPFVKEKSLRYRQQFDLYDGSYWMPVDIRIDVTAVVGAMMFKFPPISFSQTSVLSNYIINTTIPDSIFHKPRLTVDSVSTATLDPAIWQSANVLPLTPEEAHAYETLDSTQTLDVQFRGGGFAINLGTGTGDAASRVRFLDSHFNRVEGFSLGARIVEDSLLPAVQLRGSFGYGFSDKRSKYAIGATLFSSSNRTLGIGADVYRILDHRTDAGHYGAMFNSVTSLFWKNDYRDYYEAEGWRVFLTFTPASFLETRMAYVNEEHRSVEQRSNYSLFSRSRSYRGNPPISDGSFSILRWDLRIGEEPVALGIVRRNALRVELDRMSASGTSAMRISASGTLTIPTFNRSLLLPAALSLHVASGTIDRPRFPQQLFTLESASSAYAPFGVFKGMRVKEFGGKGFLAINLEHNFRSIPFLALGIPFLYENSIELILHGGAARTWSSFAGNIPSGTQATNGWYGEIGFGISRIFDLLRADFTWRLKDPRTFHVTVGIANLF